MKYWGLIAGYFKLGPCCGLFQTRAFFGTIENSGAGFYRCGGSTDVDSGAPYTTPLVD